MHDLDVRLDQLGLVDVPWDAIEKKKLLVGEIPVGRNEPFDKMVPDAKVTSSGRR